MKKLCKNGGTGAKWGFTVRSELAVPGVSVGAWGIEGHGGERGPQGPTYLLFYNFLANSGSKSRFGTHVVGRSV